MNKYLKKRARESTESHQHLRVWPGPWKVKKKKPKAKYELTLLYIKYWDKDELSEP